MIVNEGDNPNSVLKSSLCDGENQSSLSLASPPESGVGEHLRPHPGDGSTSAFNSDLSLLASEIMGLFATSSPTKSEVESVLGRYMKHEGDFAVPEQRSISGTKRKSDNQINYTRSKDLQLRILDKISVPIFTKEPIKGENGAPLKVALVDNHSGEVVTYGPEASARVKIVVLEADVDGCLGEFKSKIVTKEGKGQFLTGNVIVHLNKGIGYIGSIYFPQTSIWKTKHEYRLGVMVEDASIETKIREGITESFYVKDRRLLLEKKHYPPKPSSEVWRLKGIARGGPFHQRLTKFDINTVGDFLKELNTSPQKLQDILGESMSLKLWNDLVVHTHTCILDERLQLCSSSRSQQKINALSDKTVKLEVIKMQITELCQKSVLEPMTGRAEEARNMVIDAFRNWGEVVTYDNNAARLSVSSHLFSNDLYPNPAKVDYQQAITRSPDRVPSTDATGDVFILNQVEYHDAENMDIGDMFLDFTSGIFCEDEDFQIFGAL